MFLSLIIAAAIQAEGPKVLNPGEWITAEDYPMSARQQGQEGTVRFRLKIDAKGRVTGCEVIESSGVGVLDEQTCRLMTERARFSPARDESGNAVDSEITQGVTWRLQKPPPEPATPWAAVTRLLIFGDGSLISCSPQMVGTEANMIMPLCEGLKETPKDKLMAMRGGGGPEPATVVAETNVSFAGMGAYPLQYRKRGHKLVSLVSARFDVDAEGKVENCRIVEQKGDPQFHTPLCDTVPESFVPVQDESGAAKRTEGTILTAFSVEGAS